MSTYAIPVRELDRGYSATNPASAIFERTRRRQADRGRLANQDPPPPRPGARSRAASGRTRGGATSLVVKDYGDIKISKLVPQEGRGLGTRPDPHRADAFGCARPDRDP
jgi:hypothetical protein